MLAVVAGASGLTGSCLLSSLEQSAQFDTVYAFVRKPLVAKYSKVIEVIFRMNLHLLPIRFRLKLFIFAALVLP